MTLFSGLEEEGGVTFIADDHNYDLDQYISAIASVEAMVKSPDFDNKMLLLAVQLAYESDLKTLLLSILEVLLANVDRQQNGEFELEVLTLVRCMVRLVAQLLAEPAAST